MKRVTGIGGVFFTAKDPVALRAWYKTHRGDDFAPSRSAFMVNCRVADLASLLQALRNEGCNVLEKTDNSEYGKFGWVMDPEDNKVERWQPPEGQ